MRELRGPVLLAIAVVVLAALLWLLSGGGGAPFARHASADAAKTTPVRHEALGLVDGQLAAGGELALRITVPASAGY